MKHVQLFCAENSIKKKNKNKNKEIKKKNYFTTFRKMCNITKHFEKQTIAT